MQRHAKYGNAVARSEPANLDLLQKVFGGQTAKGVGCYSSGMAKQPSYLGKSIEDLTINDPLEGSGDSDDGHATADVVPNLSTRESTSPPKCIGKTVATSSKSKRKSDTTIGPNENKRRQTNIDNVIENVVKSKADKIHETLEAMEMTKFPNFAVMTIL